MVKTDELSDPNARPLPELRQGEKRGDAVMTDEQIKAAKVLVDAATPGPWEPKSFAGNDDEQCRGLVVTEDDAQVCDAYDSTSWADKQCAANAAFIAVARTLVPKLIAEVERLRAETRKAFDAGFSDGMEYQHASEVHDWGPAPQYSDYKERGWNKFLEGDK